MILVRSVFQARYGTAGQLAQIFKEGSDAMARATGGKWRILTDLSGPYDTVVFEIVVKSLADWESLRRSMFERPELGEVFGKASGMMESGRGEFYTIEAEG